MARMNDLDQGKRARLLVNVFLPACAFVLVAFYALLFQRDNAASVVDPDGFSADGGDFLYEMEGCWSNDKKLAASGWIVRKGHGVARRTVKVVVVEDGSGQVRAMKTSQIDREDVSKDVNGRLGDAVRYRNAGFTASLNRRAAEPPIGPGALYIAFDDGGKKVMLPIPCRVGQPQ